MRRNGITAALALVIIVAACLPCQADVVFVEKGREPVPWNFAKWRIVVSPDAIPSEKTAAAEIQHHLERATGVKLPILEAPESEQHNILVGPDAGKGLATANDLGEEDLRIRITPENIAIVGGRPRGTLYGAYEFLERYLGVRFLTHDHTHVPEVEDVLEIPCEEFVFSPVFSFRWPYYGENVRQPGFASKLRCNTVNGGESLGGITPQRLINHSYGHQLPSSKYFKDHPEYFAFRDGKRQSFGKYGGPEPCCTNPDVQRIVSESVLAELKANPGRRNVSVSMNDNKDYCECPECAAVDERHDSHSAANLMLVNAAADAIRDEFPDAYVGTLAYYYTRKPPKGLKPRDNVQIQLCSIECSMVSPLNTRSVEENWEFYQDLRGWGKICDNVWIWNYNTNFHYYDMPCPNLRVIGPNVRLFAENNVKGVFMQANGNGHSGEMSDLRNYVIGRTLWDPHQDTWDLVEEFCNLHYGAAAPVILDYLAWAHDIAEAAGHEPNCFGDPYKWGFTREVVREIYERFQRALELVQDDPEAFPRVEKASICAYRAVLQCCAEAEYEEGMVRAAYPARYGNVLERYVELCGKYDMARAAERWGRDDYVNTIRKRMAGVPIQFIENDTWRLVCLGEENGKVIELTHKPTGRCFGASGDDLVCPSYGNPPKLLGAARWCIEEFGRAGLSKYITGCDVERKGDSLAVTKTFEDGSVLARVIALNGAKVHFSTRLTHKGQESKAYKLMFHPEWRVFDDNHDGRVIRAYVLDDGEYKWFNKGWGEGTGPHKDIIDNATGGGFAFFHRKKGFGILQTYDVSEGTRPRMWWDRTHAHINLEIVTPETELKPGETLEYAVACEFIDAPPGS